MAEQETVLGETSQGAEDQQQEVVELSETESYSKEQVEQIVRSALDKEIAGLKSNNSSLKEEKKKAQAKAKDFTELVDSLGGEEGIKGLVDLKGKIDQDEELRLFTSGDREKYNTRILNRAKADHEAQLKILNDEKSNWEILATEATDRYRGKEITNSINDGCADSGVNPRLYKAMSSQIKDQVFFDSETESVMVREGEGIRYGKDGAPMKVTELIDTMREDQPELFLQSTGGSALGASVTRRNTGFTNDDIRNMSVEEYKKLREENRIS